MQELLLNVQAKACEKRLLRHILKSISDDFEDMREIGSMIVKEKNFASMYGIIDAVLQKNDDLMACEWDCNEFYILGNLVEDKWGSAVSYTLECLQEKLCEKFPESVFCIMISVDQGEFPGITAHCYQVRDEEFYFDTNLENYDQPVLYAMIGSSFAFLRTNDMIENKVQTEESADIKENS